MTASPGFSRPDYTGGGISNLMSSLERALGHGCDASLLPGCALIDEAAIEQSRHVILLVVDGLGTLQLRTHAGQGALAAARRGDLTSVFPSTTASAVTTFFTGDPPRRHGLTGWYVWMREAAEVVAPLPFKTRSGRRALADEGFEAPSLFATRPFSRRLARRSHLLHPAELCDTSYTGAHAGSSQVHPFASLEELAALISKLAAQPEPSFIYAYWPMVDALSHLHGWRSEETGGHLREVDRAVEACVDRLAGSGATLLVCADHGFVDTRPDTRLALADFPEVASMLTHPLCGEPRLVYCYVKPGMEDEFEAAVAQQLASAAKVVASQRLVEDGFFGPAGQTHPELRHRIGTHALVMQDSYCLTDRLEGEDAFSLVGVHGGLSDSELRVPLCVFEM